MTRRKKEDIHPFTADEAVRWFQELPMLLTPQDCEFAEQLGIKAVIKLRQFLADAEIEIVAGWPPQYRCVLWRAVQHVHPSDRTTALKEFTTLRNQINDQKQTLFTPRQMVRRSLIERLRRVFQL